MIYKCFYVLLHRDLEVNIFANIHIFTPCTIYSTNRYTSFIIYIYIFYNAHNTV